MYIYRAYVVCPEPGGRRPELCIGPWEVLFDQDFRPQEYVTLLTLPGTVLPYQANRIIYYVYTIY